MSFSLILGLLLSAAIGFSLGLIGGGGSIITVPVLIYLIGVEPHQAIAMSMSVVGTTSLIGTILHSLRNNVVWKSGLIFGGAGTFGAIAGSRLTHLISPPVLIIIFAMLMFIVAMRMLNKKESSTQIDNSENFSPIKAVIVGLAVGVLTGFLGVGGGFLIVPALALYGGLRTKKAVGTSLLVITINCSAGLIGQMQQGSGFDPRMALLVTGLAVIGMPVGAYMSHYVKAKRLQQSFAIFVLATSLFLLVKNREELYLLATRFF